jgi:hypothetical protein
VPLLSSVGANAGCTKCRTTFASGWGGAVPKYLDLFNARAPTMRIIDRSGASEFEDVKWRFRPFTDRLVKRPGKWLLRVYS